ncbi:MAG: hypothetical protein JXA30_18820 [Deltaproteobacteria bacterium]|nr:hypothetical protein [Deltaproteobacteria bacterium]
MLVIGLPKCTSTYGVSSRDKDGEKDKRIQKTKNEWKGYIGLSETDAEAEQTDKRGVVGSEKSEARRSARSFVGTGLDENRILNHLVKASPRGFVSVGHSSVVFRVRFSSRPDAAYKPAEIKRPKGYLAEIAAYRLARCFDFRNVPPAVSRTFSRKTLRRGLTIGQTTVWPKLEERIDWDEDGSVRGAAIFWVPAMRRLNLESRSEMRRWLKWLDIEGEVPEAMRPLAKDISNMLSFDYLIGNGDRFSGGNIKGDMQGRFIYLRDHDLAFPQKIGDRVHRRIADRMLFAKRFSRVFFRKLSGLTREGLLRELGRDPMSTAAPVLDERQIQGLFDRREALLSHITSLMQLHGEDRVLSFP